MKQFAAAGLLLATALWAQEGPLVRVTVTAEARHGKTVPELQQNELRVREAGQDATVRNLSKILDGAVQLLLLIDDSATSNFDIQIPALKQWITGLPSNVAVGVGYMHNGTVQTASGFTGDHASAANSIHLAMGPAGADVSPYDSLRESIKHWPAAAAAADENRRKVVVMVTSGLEFLGGGWPPYNPYVNAAVSDAEKAGVLVYGIYNPTVGHASHVMWTELMGQSLLSQLCDATGGEAYITTIGPPVSFSPYLESITAHLTNQYTLEFNARPENKSGLQPLKVTATNGNVDVLAPKEVFVKASK